MMTIQTETIVLDSEGKDEIFDITDSVRRTVSASGLHSGIVNVFIPGSTGAVTTIEYEPGAVQDLRDALERAAPKEIRYAHNEAWGDGNGYSHVRAAWLGPSLSVPFESGRIILGTWQQIVVCDCDNKPRSRDVVIQVMGE